MSDSVWLALPRRLSTRWLLALALLVGGGATSFSNGVADDSESPAKAPAQGAFRRVFVPADSPEEWPVGSQRYLPILASEFSRLVEQDQGRSDRNDGAVRLASAAYAAELTPDALLQGTAEVVVHLASPRPRLLPLTPLNLVVRRASWNGDDSPSADVGLWGRDTTRQELAVLVRQSGTLHLTWELRAHRSNSSSMEFLLETPIAVPQSFALLLPRDYTAEIDPGVLVATEDAPDDKRRWLFQLSPTDSHQLKILSQTQTPLPQTLPRARRTTSYRLEPEGLTFLSTLRLESNQASDGQIRFALSSNVRILSARIDQQTVAWHIEEKADSTRLVVEQPSAEGPQTIEIRGFAQLQLDQPWQLPLLRAMDVSWTEGTVRLTVSPALELRWLMPQRSNLQQIVGIDAQIPSEEAYQLQEWSSEASLEVVVSRRQPEVRLRAATTIDLDPDDLKQPDSQPNEAANETTARTIAQLECRGRATYQVEAEISPGWSIESVNSEPAQALREWHEYFESPDAASEDEASKKGRKLIRVQLNLPLAPEKPLKLEFNSRTTNQGGLLPATVDQLTPLRFLDAEPTKELLLLRTADRGQMELLHGLDHARLAPDSLEPSDISLFPDLQGGVLIDSTGLAADTLVEMRPRAAQYRADVRVEVSLLPDSFVHRYKLHCNPTSGVVSEVVLRLDQPLPEFIQWELVGRRGGIVARRLGPDAEKSTDRHQGVAYLLRLPVAVDRPFQLRASYTVAAQDSHPCNLLHLPEASDWRGQVIIRGPLDGLAIEDRNWTPIAKPLDTGTESLPIAGCYRLESERTRRGPPPSVLTVKRIETAPAVADVVAWLADVRTLQSADGDAIYVASYHLENSGAAGVEIELPTHVKLQQAWLNQQQLEPREVLVGPRTCRFHFPDHQRYPTVAVQYVLQGPVLGRSTTISPSLPTCSFPINLGRWTLSIPEQYVVDGLTSGGRASELSWSERLFGPLARSPQTPRFNPFRADSWTTPISAPIQQQAKQLPAIRSSATENRLHASKRADLDRRLSTVELPNPPWKSPSASLLIEIGRHPITVEFINTTPSVVVYREIGQRAKWYAIWLLSLVLGTWQLARSPGKSILAAIVLAAACLIVPPNWVAEFQAVFLGVLAAVVLKIVLSKLFPEVPKQSTLPVSTQTVAVATLFGCFLISGLAYAGPEADVPRETSTQSHTGLYQVLFPVDSQGNTAGDDVYLPEAFLRQLQETPSNLSQDGAQYALKAALYRGKLPTDDQESDSKDKLWSLAFEIESFVKDGQLHLPLRRDEAAWQEELHRLDGLPVALKWNQDGIGCTIRLGEAGMHRLELFVEPKTVVSSKLAQLQLHVPPMAGAKLELGVPSNIHDLHIASAGRIEVDETSGRWYAPLSTNGKLELQWTLTQETKEAGAIREIEQLAWLHIEPSVARLDVQLRIHDQETIPEFVTLETSPQLKLMPLDENSPIDQFEVNPETPQIIKLKFKAGLGPQVRVALQFQLQRTVSLGRIAYPWVRLQGAKVSRSWFAVSVSSGLSYDESLSEEIQSISATEFASEWGATDQRPLYAYSQNDEMLDGFLRVWPDPQTMAVQQTMRVHCESEYARIEYEAAVDQVVGSWLVHRLVVPSQFVVEDVAVRRQPDLEAVPARWSRVNNSQIVIFLGQPLGQPHLISLRGKVDLSAKGELTLPAVSLVGAGNSDIHLDISREPNVLVSWSNPQSSPVELSQQGIPPDRKAIPVGRYVWRTSEATELGPLHVEKNNPVFHAETLTTIAQGTDGWDATLHCRISVKQGLLSHIAMEVPSTFQGPYQIQPENAGMVSEILETAAGRRIVLLLSHPVSQRKTVELHVTGGLGLPADGRLEFPNLRLINVAQADRYILLPAHLGKRSIAWDWTGLTTKPLPKNLRHLVASPEGSRALLVNREKFLAREHSYHGPLDRAALRYAIVSCDLDQYGEMTAAAELVLQPGRATRCRVRLPPGAQLLQLVAGDSQVRREKINDRDWRVSLGPPLLPRKIKVVYHTKIEMTGRRVQLTPPQILIGDQPLPLPRTRWKIRCIGELRLGDARVGSALLPEQFARAAHQLPLKALADSRLLALELPIEEGRAWFFPWQQDTQQAWNLWCAIEPSADIVSENGPVILGADGPANEQADDWSVLVGRLGTLPKATKHFSATAVYPPRLPLQPASLFVPSETHFLSDERGQLELTVLSAPYGSVWQWSLAAALFSSTFALLLYRKVKVGWNEIVGDRPHFMAAMAGLVWWLVLSPSILGLLIIVLTLLSRSYQKGLHLWQQRG